MNVMIDVSASMMMVVGAWMVFMNRGRNSDKTAPQKQQHYYHLKHN
jgi:hypothetical protein